VRRVKMLHPRQIHHIGNDNIYVPVRKGNA